MCSAPGSLRSSACSNDRLNSASLDSDLMKSGRTDGDIHNLSSDGRRKATSRPHPENALDSLRVTLTYTLGAQKLGPGWRNVLHRRTNRAIGSILNARRPLSTLLHFCNRLSSFMASNRYMLGGQRPPLFLTIRYWPHSRLEIHGQCCLLSLTSLQIYDFKRTINEWWL
jgi:hypothetical protein